LNEKELIPNSQSGNYHSFAHNTKIEKSYTSEQRNGGIKQSAVFSQGDNKDFVESKNFANI
jgi:hypothetical protein